MCCLPERIIVEGYELRAGFYKLRFDYVAALHSNSLGLTPLPLLS